MEALANISILLVSPKNPGNVGATARAMKNMGLRRLKLVDPCDYLAPESVAFAVGAADLLHGAQTFEDFEQAVSDDRLVIGTTSARGRRVKTQLSTVREAAPRIRDVSERQRVCLVFGPERSGLNESQLARCQQLVTIPSADEFPTLNLAQSVLIVAHEIFSSAGLYRNEEPDLADQASLEEMFAQMEQTLLEIGFLSSGNPDHIMRSIRRFLGRADLSPRDVRIVRGIVRQMEWYVREGHRLDPRRVIKP